VRTGRHLLVAGVGLAALIAGGVASAAEGPQDPDVPRVIPAGYAPPELVRQIDAGTRLIFQKENPFHLEISDLGKNGADISELLLQVFDPDAAPNGRWKGYGLMELKTERRGVGEVRSLSASIDFVAPAEGIYSLRTVARDRAGNLERKTEDLRDIQWQVVLDRTAPKVELAVPAGDGKPLQPGDTVELGWKVREGFLPEAGGRPVLIEISRNGGATWLKLAEPEKAGREGRFDWKVDGADTEALLFRISVRDAAGNVTTVASAKPLAVKHPPVEVKSGPATGTGTGTGTGTAQQPLPVEPGRERVRHASQALLAYQTGVIYMDRGELEEAAKYFEEAIRLDYEKVPAYVDLTATYLGLYDRNRALGAGYLDKAARAAADGLKVLPREVALYYNQAQAQYRMGKLDAAAASLNSGLAVHPRHVESLYLLALVRSTQKRTGDAVILWRQVAAIGGMSHRDIEKRLAREAVRCLAEIEKQEAARTSSAKPKAPAESALQ